MWNNINYVGDGGAVVCEAAFRQNHPGLKSRWESNPSAIHLVVNWYWHVMQVPFQTAISCLLKEPREGEPSTALLTGGCRCQKG